MCDCDDKGVTEQERFAVLAGTPCDKIGIDLLNVYLKPILCYLKHGLWGNIGSSKEELESARDWLNNFIAQKRADPADCTGIESLYIIRVIVDKILKKGVCL